MDDRKSWVSKHQNLGMCFRFGLSLHEKNTFFLFSFFFVVFVCLTAGKTPGLYAIVVKGTLQRGGQDYDNDDPNDYET